MHFEVLSKFDWLRLRIMNEGQGFAALDSKEDSHASAVPSLSNRTFDLRGVFWSPARSLAQKGGKWGLESKRVFCFAPKLAHYLKSAKKYVCRRQNLRHSSPAAWARRCLTKSTRVNSSLSPFHGQKVSFLIKYTFLWGKMEMQLGGQDPCESQNWEDR